MANELVPELNEYDNLKIEHFTRINVAGYEWVRIREHVYVCVLSGDVQAYVVMREAGTKPWILTKRIWTRFGPEEKGLLKLRVRKLKRYKTLLEAQQAIALLEGPKQTPN